MIPVFRLCAFTDYLSLRDIPWNIYKWNNDTSNLFQNNVERDTDKGVYELTLVEAGWRVHGGSLYYSVYFWKQLGIWIF